MVKKEKTLRCHTCGMTYNDFRKIGKLGCSDCYAAFRNVLLPLLKSIHGSTHHTGKEPLKVTPIPQAEEKDSVVSRQPQKVKLPNKANRIAELRIRLKKAIGAEEYEQAAILRDRIHALEKA